MLAELDRINYGQEQANLAVAWILYGDWRMKGANPTLELSDFFIGEDRLESVRQSLEGRYFLLTPEEFDQHMNWSYTQGYDKAMTECGAKTPEFYRKQAADKEVDRKSLTNVDPEYRNVVIEWNEMCRRHGLPVFQSDTETSL